MQVVNQAAVLFVLMALGYFIAKKRILDKSAFNGLNKFVLFFSLPCLTFAKLQQDALPGQMGELLQTFLLATVSMLLCGGIALLYTRREPEKRRSVFVHMAMFSNCGYMGYPLIIAALGEEKLIYAVMYVASFSLLTWTVGVYLYAGKAGLSLKKLLLNPTLIAVTLGTLFFALSIRIPKIPLNAMNMLGDTTTPLSMVIIGALLAELKLPDLKDGMMLFSCLMRLVVIPLAVWGILTLLNVPRGVLEGVFICTAMPGSAATAMQAEFFHGDGLTASRGVAVSTALSIITIPLILQLL